MLDRRFAGVLPWLYAPVDEADDEATLVLRPFVGTLSVSYVVEQGDSTRALALAELAGGTTAQALHERALANLVDHVEATGIRLSGHGSIMAVTFDGDMEASLMLYPPLWARLQDEMGDQLAVAVPARDVLAVAPLDSAAGLSELGSVIERVWPRDDHPLSSDIFVMSDGAWSVFAGPFPP